MEEIAFKYSNDYDTDRLELVLRQSFKEIKLNIEKEVSAKKVLIKPNLLGAYYPEDAVTTHPNVIEALIRILKETNCEIWLGDSPNGVQKNLREVWIKTGMERLCEKYNVEKKYFEKEGASVIGDLLISNVVLEADYVINMPKFKTHSLTLLTGAVKNMFGVVPGLKKTDYHRNAKSTEAFAETIVRIAEVKKPNLNILDGIDVMAGNGPSAGFKLNVGLIAVARDMHLLDKAMAGLVKISADDVVTLKAASNLGFVNLNEEYKLVGDKNVNFSLEEFKLPVSYTSSSKIVKLFLYILEKVWNGMKVKPKVKNEKCAKCGMCINICPVSTIKYHNNFPHVDIRKCINCYCCHEVCPEKAIDLRESKSMKIVKWISNR